MKKAHNYTRQTILSFIDLFYPLFKHFMPIQTFRYAACGGFNVLFSIVLYSIGYNFIFKKQDVSLGFITLSAHIAADYLFAIWIAFPVGFYLSRYVVFQESTLKRRVQLFRYFLVNVGSIILNYLFLKLFIDQLHFFPTIGKAATTVFVIIYSYVSQRNFSFKTHKPKTE
jgi:putative flippase GtrA